MDSLAHAFWPHVHMLVVHRVQGKEHVHYELFKMARDTEKDKGGLKHKASIEESDHLAVTLPVCLPADPAALVFSKPLARYQCIYSSTCQLPVFPPPKAA